MSGMTSERLAEVARLVDLDIGLDRKGAADLLAHVDHLTAENATLRHAYMAHAEVCDHDEPTVLGQLDNARQNVLDLTADNARLTKGMSRPHASVEIWHGTISRDLADSLIRDALRALLNPPTEGGTDA